MPWPWIGFSTAIAAGGVGLLIVGCWMVPQLWQAVRTHSYFALTEMTVRGNERLPCGQILDWAGLRPGMSLWDADPGTISTRLSEHPDLARAWVRREFPRRLVVTVREHRRVAIAVLENLYFVDRTGHLMGRLHESESRNLPLITGLRDVDLDEGGSVLLRRAVRLVRLCEREGCGAGVSEVHVDRERGATLIPLRQRVAIVLGWGAWRAKLARAKRVLEAWKGAEDHLAVLDASFRNQVIVHPNPPLPVRQMGFERSGKTGVRT